jgi:hypothetical protein
MVEQKILAPEHIIAIRRFRNRRTHAARQKRLRDSWRNKADRAYRAQYKPSERTSANRRDFIHAFHANWKKKQSEIASK